MRIADILQKSRAYAGECAGSAAVLVRRDAWFYGAVAAYTLVCFLLLAATGRFDLSSHRNYLGQWTYLFLWMMPLLAVVYEMLRVTLRFRTRRGRAYRIVFSARRMARLVAGMAAMMALMVFQGSFTSIKNLFPLFHGGFPYDRLHADIDRWLHFGHEPWALLHAVFGNTLVLRAAEWNYSVLWFTLCFGGLFFVATSPKADPIRFRYLVMFIFVWVFCGNVLAGPFLSAGPVFYGEAIGDTERFAALRAFVAEGSSASQFQHYLWRLYESDMAGFGSGISAFPSVHVALIAMNALFLAERSRRLAVAGALYTAVILASSVYLGWHYAIDGYVSLLAVAAAHVALRHRQAARAQRQGVAAPRSGGMAAAAS